MKALPSSILFLLVLTLFSCGEKPYFMDTYTFENQKWMEDTTPVFEVNFNGDSSSYDVIFTFRTSTNYEFNNLWLYMSTGGPSCNEMEDKSGFLGRKAKELKIAKKNGEWMGQKSGTFIENKLYYIRSRFCKGIYAFKLEQGVTMKELGEIHDVTIEVLPTNWKK
tara:strand:+ start:496 stop:990 length:495 start_codon:yes stop_codon:yes gene_type:complete